MMFGYASNETPEYMPISLSLAHTLLIDLAAIRKEGKEMTYLRPDAKSQVTVEYDGDTNKPARIHTIVISTQHDEFVLPADDSKTAQDTADNKMLEIIKNDVKNILLPRVLDKLSDDTRTLFDQMIV